MAISTLPSDSHLKFKSFCVTLKILEMSESNTEMSHVSKEKTVLRDSVRYCPGNVWLGYMTSAVYHGRYARNQTQVSRLPNTLILSPFGSRCTLRGTTNTSSEILIRVKA